MVGDFSQNYSFVFQDAVQGVHWSNTSCTLHPWMAYYRGVDGTIQTYSLLFISDSLIHETTTVYAFQEKLVPLIIAKLKQDSITLVEIEYFSDGCSKQYKNKKNFLNLNYHKDDFGVPAKWSFSAISHGKGPWDGLAGSVKREATLESLRRLTENHIQTARDLYNFAKEKFKKVDVQYISAEHIEALTKEILNERFKEAQTIKGTLKLHSFEPISENHKQINVKRFSLLQTAKTVSIARVKGKQQSRDIDRGSQSRVEVSIPIPHPILIITHSDIVILIL